jgi:DNA polymerase III delta subunit
MLYVYFGTDVIRVREEAFAYIDSLKKDGAETVHVSADNYTEGIFTDLLESASLFGNIQIIVIDTLSENKEAFATLLERTQEMHANVNQFVVIEKTLLAPEKKKLHAHADEIHECTKEGEEKFNAFSLTDAFVARDRKKLWMLLIEAWRQKISNEEIVGILFWQVKILRLAERTKTAEEAGQKPFVYQKAKRALSSFKKGELDQMSRNLLTMYHEGHMGKCDMNLALEKWVLGM